MHYVSKRKRKDRQFLKLTVFLQLCMFLISR